MSNPIRFSLNISAERYLSVYQGQASTVSVVAEDGRRVQFPAQALRPFVTRNGIQGRFQLLIDENNRLQGLERLGN
jgi:hypothetical protein